MIKFTDYRTLADISYWVDKNKEDVPFHPKKNKKLKIEDIDGLSQSYKVLEIEDNPHNGMQAMAVAPIVNGKPDTSQIVIAYAGTNFKDGKDKTTDAQTVVGGIKGYGPWTKGQAQTALDFAKEIEEKYEDATITTTGHSLGEYLAMYVAAEKRWQNIGFNGPDAYNILSKDAKKWLAKHPGVLKNYRNQLDVIGNYGGNRTGAEILVNLGGVSGGLVDAHSLGLWNWLIDEEGNLIIPDKNTAKGRIFEKEVALISTMNSLTTFRDSVLAGGKGSSNEKIFFDSMAVLSIVNGVKDIVNQSLTEVKTKCQQATTEIEKLWGNGLTSARGIGADLSEVEILEALAMGGSTKASVVAERTQPLVDKLAEYQVIVEQYETLAESIQNSVQKLADKDQEIAELLQVLQP